MFRAVSLSIELPQTLIPSHVTQSDHDVLTGYTRSACAPHTAGHSCQPVCGRLALQPPFSTVLNKQYYTLKQKKSKKLFHPLTPAVQKVPNQITVHSCHIILSRLH